MARTREPARIDTLAGEAWAAGCRDVQAAINWAAGRGHTAGPPFQAAFRRVAADQQAAPPPAPVEEPAARRAEVAKPARRTRTAARTNGTPAAAPAPVRAASTAARRVTAPKPAGGPRTASAPAAEPTPLPATPAADPRAGGPAEFVEDLRVLRRLVTKYGKKGLSDLVGLLGA